MTINEKYLESFESYYNGNMNAAEKEAFHEDLKRDNGMLDAWNEYCTLMNALSDKQAISLRQKLENEFTRHYKRKSISRRTSTLWFRLSTAAVFVIFLGCLLYFFCSNSSSFRDYANSYKLTITDTNKFPVEKNLGDTLAADKPIHDNNTSNDSIVKNSQRSIYEKEAYQISPMYAELLHNVYRSGWFQLTTPIDSVIFAKGDTLTFTWETNINEPLYFDVLDRNGIVIYKHPNSIDNPYIYIPQLKPAIYMYRFATKDQPVWMGVMVEIY